MFQAAIAIQAKVPQVHFWIPLSLEIYRQPIEQFRLWSAGYCGIGTDAVSDRRQPITKSGTVNLEIAF